MTEVGIMIVKHISTLVLPSNLNDWKQMDFPDMYYFYCPLISYFSSIIYPFSHFLPNNTGLLFFQSLDVHLMTKMSKITVNYCKLSSIYWLNPEEILSFSLNYIFQFFCERNPLNVLKCPGCTSTAISQRGCKDLWMHSFRSALSQLASQRRSLNFRILN